MVGAANEKRQRSEVESVRRACRRCLYEDRGVYIVLRNLIRLAKYNKEVVYGLFLSRLRGLRRKVRRLCRVLVRARAGSIQHGCGELAPPILATYYVLY